MYWILAGSWRLNIGWVPRSIGGAPRGLHRAGVREHKEGQQRGEE